MGASAETLSIRTHETQEVVRYKRTAKVQNIVQRLQEVSAQKTFKVRAHEKTISLLRQNRLSRARKTYGDDIGSANGGDFQGRTPRRLQRCARDIGGLHRLSAHTKTAKVIRHT